MVVVGGRRAEQTQDFMIFIIFGVLHLFGEVFVDLVPEGCPKPLGGPPYRDPIGALPIGPIGPDKGPIRALIGPYFGYYFRFLGWPVFPLCHFQ